jgi:hypothetical protein
MRVIDDAELPRRIPWETFQNGETWEVTPVIEFQKTPRQFCAALSIWARRHGRRSTWKTEGDTVTFRMELLREEGQ